MGGQLAKLYLRGNLMYTTAKELPQEDKDKVQRLMMQAWSCPLIRNGLSEFCMALARTIGNEYRDYEAGMQDAHVTFWRAGLMVLYHESRKCQRCAKSYTTTYEIPSYCVRTLKYWCDQPRGEGSKGVTGKPHGTCKPTVINTKWLEDNDLNNYEISPKDQKEIDKVRKGDLFKIKVCPECLIEKKVHIVHAEQECLGDLDISWEPKPEIASEVTFTCNNIRKHKVPNSDGDIHLPHTWKEQHDGDPVESSCSQCEKIIKGDYIKRKKFFQTYLFNYLKQILKENKPPSIKEELELSSPADDVLMEMICELLTDEKNRKKNKVEHSTLSEDHSHTIFCETGLIPQRMILQIAELKDEFEPMGVNVATSHNQIHITPLFNLNDRFYAKMITRLKVKKAFVKHVSLDGPDDDSNNFRDFCEYKAKPDITVYSEQIIDELDRISVIRSRLPENAREVLDLIVHTPDAYYKEFRTERIHKNHVMQFLGKSQREVEEAFSAIKCHLLAEGLTPDF